MRSSRRCRGAALRRRISFDCSRPRRRSRCSSTGAPQRERRARSSSRSATSALAPGAWCTPRSARSRRLARSSLPSSRSSAPHLHRHPPPLVSASPRSLQTSLPPYATPLLACPRRVKRCIWCLTIWRLLGAGTRGDSCSPSFSVSTISSVCHRSCSFM